MVYLCISAAPVSSAETESWRTSSLASSPPLSPTSTPASTRGSLVFFLFSFFSFLPPSPPSHPPLPPSPLSKVRGINLLRLIALERFTEQMHSSLLLRSPPPALLFFLTLFFFTASNLFFSPSSSLSPFASFPTLFLDYREGGKKTLATATVNMFVIMFLWHVCIVVNQDFNYSLAIVNCGAEGISRGAIYSV